MNCIFKDSKFNKVKMVLGIFNLKTGACVIVLCLTLFSGQSYATLIGDVVTLNRHWQLTDGTDNYARSTPLSALVTDDLGPEFNDFGSWRVNMHVDIEETSIEISERGYTSGGDGYISVFSSNNNFHRLEITDLNFTDPDLSIVGVTLDLVEGTTPVTLDDIDFGDDYLYVGIGGSWSDASRIVVGLQTAATAVPASSVVPEPDSIFLISLGVLCMFALGIKRKKTNSQWE